MPASPYHANVDRAHGVGCAVAVMRAVDGADRVPNM